MRTLDRNLGVPALALAIVLGGCGAGATPSSSASDAPPSPSESATRSPAASASTPEPSTHAIVGEWLGVHDCERIVSMLTDAGLDEFVLEQIYGNGLVPGVDSESDLEDPSQPCKNAVPRAHSHFFTADGFFGSRDFNGEQVDDGGYRFEGTDTVVINGTPFRFQVDGDELTLEPPFIDISSCTIKDCRFPAAWALMVAMPGTTWTRGIMRN
jgi:hypothetical protein